MRQLESIEQQKLFTWWRFEGAKRLGFPECVLFAIPNGGRRDAVTGARLKAEGVHPGIPDIFLAVPDQYRSGLFIEMKRPKAPGVRAGSPSKAQREVMQALIARGYCCKVAYGADEARRVIEWYLGWEEEA